MQIVKYYLHFCTMKKIILFILLIIGFGQALSGQVQTAEPADATANPNVIKPPLRTNRDSTWLEEYCSVIARGRLLSEEVTIAIDYGDNPNNRKRLRDKKGDIIKFSSVIDALNFQGEQGWKLVNAFPVSGASNSAPQYTYVFKREYWGKKPKY